MPTIPSLTNIEITGDTLLSYSPGAININIANGPPFTTVGVSVDTGPVLVTVVLDENGGASSISVPVDTTVGTHTVNVVST